MKKLLRNILFLILLNLVSGLFSQTVVNNDWTLIESNVGVWKISKIDDTRSYYYDYVTTGESKPSRSTKGVFFDGLSFESSSTEKIDIYLKVLRGTGLVRVETQPILSNQQEPSFSSYQAKDYFLAVNMGQISGHSIVDKFGENPDIDTGTTPEDIWENGGVYIYDANGTAPIVSLISDNPLDTMDIIVVGLDINGNEVEQTLTLNGTTRVALITPLWRVYRMANAGVSGEDINGTVYCYVGTGGVPIAANTRAIIDDGNNQTLMALYTIPRGKVGFLLRGELGGSRSQSSGAYQCAYYSRRYGKVFRIKKRVDITNSGSSIYVDKRSAPDIIPSLTDIKLRVESVTANSSGVFGTFDIMLVDESYFSDEYLQAIGQVGY